MPVPIDVVVSDRATGEEYGRATLEAETDRPSDPSMTVAEIATDRIVDVTFINNGSVPALFDRCFVIASRSVESATTVLESALIESAFNGAIASLNPTITAINGSVLVELEGELASKLGIERLSYSTDWDFDGEATFEAQDFRISNKGSIIGAVIDRFIERALLPKLTAALLAMQGHTAIPKLRAELGGAEFTAALREAFFDRQRSVRDTIVERVIGLDSRLDPDDVRPAVDGALDDAPMLEDRYVRHLESDPAFTARYALTGIGIDWKIVDLRLDELSIEFFVAFTNGRATIPAPYDDLPFDTLTIGTVSPSIHAHMEVGDFDVEIDDPPAWLDVLTLGTASLVVALTEMGLEALLDFVANGAERAIPKAIHRIFADFADEYGELIASTFEAIADRDSHFSSIAASEERLAISTIDPRQLLDPDRRPRSTSPTVHIDELVSAALPIDHDPKLATVITPGPTPSDLLNRIDHFVFVMMENRSFDHMLGYLSHPDHGGRSDVDGLDGASRALGGDMTGTQATPLVGPMARFGPNLPHDYESIVRQINGGAMDGFASEYALNLRSRLGNWTGVQNDPERALRFQRASAVPTYDRLAREYVVCDRWFSSMPAGTYPNRACYYSGVTPALTNGEIADDFGYLEDLTLFDVLDHVGVDWKLYESDVSFLRVYKRFRLDTTRIRPIEEFADPLPTVSFVDPNFTGFPSADPNNDDQPNTDIAAGQAFIKRIVDTVEDSASWDSTMLVITYDEHGGFADHVPPPGTPGWTRPDGAPAEVPRSHPEVGFYGVRVPTFIVSPLTKRGDVAHQIFDHAAVFRTLVERFAPQYRNSRILPERVRRSRHLGEVLANQPPRTAPTSRTNPRSSVLGDQRSFVHERLDVEDAAAALRQIGRPSAARGARSQRI